MLPLQKIICPTDFSNFSYSALEKANELAAHFGAELCVLHVTEPVTMIYGISSFPGSITWDLPAYEQAVFESAEQELAKLVERHHFKTLKVRSMVRRGNPADEIVSAAAQEGADLIVIATHGLTGWRQHIFGSVAEKVLRLAHCPVLVTRVAKPEGA